MLIDIEIHGVFDRDKEKRVRAKVFSVFEQLYGDEGFLVNICRESVVDFNSGCPGVVHTGNPEGRQPFFRVHCTSAEELDIISDKLRPFKFDIQFVLLARFIRRYDYNEPLENRLERPAETRFEDE